MDEEKLKKFLSKWIQIPDESANHQMQEELDELFFVPKIFK